MSNGANPLTVLVAAALTLLTACGTTKEEATTPTTSPPPPTTSQPPTTKSVPKAPPVAAPLDARHFELAPCDSLTAGQRQDFGIRSAEPVNITQDGEECLFVRHPGDTVYVLFASNVDSGLSHLYAQNADRTWDYWEPTEIDGIRPSASRPSLPSRACAASRSASPTPGTSW